MNLSTLSGLKRFVWCSRGMYSHVNARRMGSDNMKPLILSVVAAFAAFSAEADPLVPLIDEYEAYTIEAAKPDLNMLRKKHLDEMAHTTRELFGKIKTIETDRTTDKAIMLRLLNANLVAIENDLNRVPFNGDWGFQAAPVFMALKTKLNNRGEADAYTESLYSVPSQFSENISNMRRGVETGWVSHADPLNTVIEQIQEQITSDPDESDLFKPYLTLPADMDPKTVAEIQQEGRGAVLRTILAYEDVLRFLETEYRLSVREAPGLVGLPGGREVYLAQLEEHTAGAGYDPETIHQLGQSEVLRIRDEMNLILEELKFEGDIAAFIAFLKTEPRFYAESEEALLLEADILAEQLREILPAYFGRLPELDFEVAPVPDAIAAGYTSARYVQGDRQREQMGRFLVNTYALDQRPLYELPALAAHEAVPGHHLQIALAQEMENVPWFRRGYYATAFGEGWALYAESIAGEAGIYETPYERFGALSMEMWRACRLVADTGLHWYGWSREEAEACFRENTALSELNIRNEVTRYIGWPGQATAYKVGELKIKALRARAEAELGGAFDIRAFHDTVLREGAVPLDVLEHNIEAWLVTERAKTAPVAP
ncbi:MAG: DUF885 domain-containing protein [Hyphomonas sp.]